MRVHEIPVLLSQGMTAAALFVSIQLLPASCSSNRSIDDADVEPEDVEAAESFDVHEVDDGVHETTDETIEDAAEDAPEPGVSLVLEGGWNPKYNAVENKVAFNMQRAVLGDHDIYTMNPDGTDVQRITDDTPGSGHKGEPYWYPDGQHIIFTAEDDSLGRHPDGYGYPESPALGRNNNVWIMKADGGDYWKMTDVEENGAYIRPSFSHDGTKVLWLEEYSMELDPVGCSWKVGEPTHPGWDYCNQRIVWGDFEFAGGGPAVSNIHKVVLEGLFIMETSGFSVDDRRIIFDACNPAEIEELTGEYTCRYGGDIYTCDMSGGDLARITNDPLGNNENEEYSPDGTRIFYYRADGPPASPGDWHVMKIDGSDYPGPGTRITWFSDTESPYYFDNNFGGEGSWLDGAAILLSSGYWYMEGWMVVLESNIFRVDVPPVE